MKKILMFLVLTFSMGVSEAQDAIAKFYGKYANDNSFTQVNVSSKMFSMFTEMEVEDPGDQEILNAISKLRGLKILAKENTDKGKILYQEAFNLIPKKDYEELMSIRDNETDMKFMIKEREGKISELLMIMGSKDEFMLLSLFGEIDLKQVSKIGKKMNIQGLDNLKNMSKDSSQKEFSK